VARDGASGARGDRAADGRAEPAGARADEDRVVLVVEGFRGRRWLDGGLSEPVPLASALAAGATHVLVLLTRPRGDRAEAGAPSATASSSGTCGR
jgi:predicted acylesterase/phospholipase RssA